MGMAYILWIYDDAVRDAKYEPDKYSQAVGEAVLSLCRSAQWSEVPTSATVLNHHNCVNRAGEQHSDWQAVYLWAGNCLWSASNMSDMALERAKELIDEEIENRKKASDSKA